MQRYAIGLDFGTESARALLVSVINGEIIATAVFPYPDGVIDEVLPGSENRLPPNWALQNPVDWLTALKVTIREVMTTSSICGEDVVGIGIDFTSCTVLPTLEDGTPLCQVEGFQDQPHSWAKLWKHHGAQPQADRINQLAIQREEPWLARYGSIISSEWLMPKALEVLEQAPDLYNKAKYFVEGADWVAWQLTGKLARNACCSGYKGTWNKLCGYPKQAFLKELNPDLEDLFVEKVSGPILPPGTFVGTLASEWAEQLGLTQDCAVAAAIIDAHSAAIGGGLSEPGTMFLIMGTSTCHMLMSDKEVMVEGISGVVEDGIVPGYFGYEAGQVSVGDIFAWYVENGVPGEYASEAEKKGVSIHNFLSSKAMELSPGESGLLALDWWNGCRTPLVDADLSGMLLGYHLQTKPEEIYRALIEATAYGTRLIIELFQKAGVSVRKLRASGGLTKNELVMRIYADVTGLPIEIASSPQASALGAAINGAVAGGVYPNIHAAVQVMAAPPSQVVQTDSENHVIYSEIFMEYKKLVTLFGRDSGSIMKNMLKVRKNSLNKIRN